MIASYAEDGSLRRELIKSGVPSKRIGEPLKRKICSVEKLPCSSGQVKGLGLVPVEEALLAAVASDGLGNWAKKAEIVSKKIGKAVTARELTEAWNRIRPDVKQRLDAKIQPEMECGHTCRTCPTRQDCQLHDALDIEDIAAPS